MLPIQWHRETGAVLPLPLRCLGLGLPTATLARYFCPPFVGSLYTISLFASFLLCTIGLSVYPGSLPPSSSPRFVGRRPDHVVACPPHPVRPVVVLALSWLASSSPFRVGGPSDPLRK